MLTRNEEISVFIKRSICQFYSRSGVVVKYRDLYSLVAFCLKRQHAHKKLKQNHDGNGPHTEAI